MKITVITVAYNAEETLSKTLKSVQSQTHIELEHIVIDGGSTDSTKDIIIANQEGISSWVSEPDQGIYDAMNKGINLATGDLIGFLNADDVYAHSEVLSSIAAAIETTGADSVIADLVYVSPENKVTRRYSSKKFCPERIAFGWMPAHPTFYIKNEKVKEIGLFKTDYKIAGDFEYIARAFHKHHISYTYIEEVLVHMRTGGVSTQNWRSNVILNNEILRACRENDIPTNLFKIYSKYPQKLLEYLAK